IACSTARRARSETFSPPLITRDAVPRPTPAFAATSSRVGRVRGGRLMASVCPATRRVDVRTAGPGRRGVPGPPHVGARSRTAARTGHSHHVVPRPSRGPPLVACVVWERSHFPLCLPRPTGVKDLLSISARLGRHLGARLRTRREEPP